MSRYTTEQHDWADQVLNSHTHRLKALGDETPEIVVGHPTGNLLDQLKARVITGETLSEVDRLNARNTLSVDEQAELRTFLNEDPVTAEQLDEWTEWVRQEVEK
jgi:hypothetical protein